jgi:hypothetical protein
VAPGASYDATTIATGLANPLALTAAGGALYWVEPGTGIRTMAPGGGSPTTAIDDPDVTDNLTSDGLWLYYVDSGTAFAVKRARLDGSAQQTVLSPTLLASSEQAESQLSVENGNVYFAQYDERGSLALYSIAADGSQSTATRVVAGPIEGFAGTDAAHAFFTAACNDGHVPCLFVWPLAGGSPHEIDVAPWGDDASGVAQRLGAAGGFVFSAKAYMNPDADSVIQAFSEEEVSLTDPGGYLLTQLNNTYVTAMVVDGRGLYVSQSVPSDPCPQGIYSISVPPGWNAPSSSYQGGRPTQLAIDATGCARSLALDDARVYWVSGCDASSSSLHAVAR